MACAGIGSSRGTKRITAFQLLKPADSRRSSRELRQESYFRLIVAFHEHSLHPGNVDFAPRIGVAYSPQAPDGTLLGKLFGSPGETSLRAGFGMYYTAIEALTLGILAGNAPFGISYSSPAPPLFATPFITTSTGQNLGQPFPVALVAEEASSGHPNANVDWSQYEPISGIPGYATSNRIPYVEEYMLSLERQLGSSTVLSVNYLGTQSHRLLVMEEANPAILRFVLV